MSNKTELEPVHAAEITEFDRETATALLQSHPRLLGRLAVELGYTDHILMGVIDGGAGLDELLGAAEMHRTFGDLLDLATESGKTLIISDTPDGWVPSLAWT